MRPEKLYLTDILIATTEIAAFIADVDQEEFLVDDMRRSAVAWKVVVIGEAAKNISASLREKYPSVAWSQVARMRDRIAHGYFGVDYNIVWDTVTRDMPVLRGQVVRILEQEFDE